MTHLPPLSRPLRGRLDASRAVRRTRGLLVSGALALSMSFVAAFALAPPAPPSESAILASYASANAQQLEVPTLRVAEHLEASTGLARDDYEATQGIDSLVASGTNYDWAKLVLLFAGFPMSDSNVTVITRWMRQENYIDSWWLRNNPLNNGWGASYGPGGTGSNVDLVAAARNAADALTRNGGYAGIRAAFREGTDSAAVEHAIWASPWASGHYANGSHWHYTDVPVVRAPASAWGR